MGRGEEPKNMVRKRKGSAGSAASDLDEQMRRIELRGLGDKQISSVQDVIRKATELQSHGHLPWLPGQWTQELFELLIKLVEQAETEVQEGKKLYTQAHAKDKLELALEVEGEVFALRQRIEHIQEGESLIKQAEQTLQDATRKGWPWGEGKFEEAKSLVERARQELCEAGETGIDEETQRSKESELALERMKWRVLNAERDCKRERAPVEVLIQKLSSKDVASRQRALNELSQIGRAPIPRGVTFWGKLEVLEDAEEWREGSGKGDAEVVDAIMMEVKDPDWAIRKSVVEALPRAAAPNEPKVLQAIISLLEDPISHVKLAAFDSLPLHVRRGNPQAIDRVVACIKDPEPGIRHRATMLLPDVVAQPVDDHAIQALLTCLQHSSGSGERVWITEEADVIVDTLRALALIAPKGHDLVIRHAISILQTSHAMALIEFTSFARDPNRPLTGGPDDVGQSRGPVSLACQFREMITLPPAHNAVKRCKASEQVRLECIALLHRVSVSGADFEVIRQQISSLEKKVNNTELDQPQRDLLNTLQGRSYAELIRYSLVMEALCDALLDFHRDVRWSAAQTLCSIAERNDSHVIQGISTCIRDSDPEIRQLGVAVLKGDTFGKVVDEGNTEMTDVLCMCLYEEDKDVRTTAAKALHEHCPKGDPVAVYFLIQKLADERSYVRDIALTTLGLLAPIGEQKFLREIDPLVRDVEPEVRIMAMYALVKLSKHADASTKQILQELLFDEDAQVRCTATYAVAHLCSRGDAKAADALMENCDDVHLTVRRASIDALTRLTPKGDVATIETALKLLDDPSDIVRKQAYDTLTKVADKGNHSVCSRIIARIGTEKGSALQALASLKSLPWSAERSIVFSRGSGAHSSGFWWSATQGGIHLEDDFRMPGGIPVHDSAQLRQSYSQAAARLTETAGGRTGLPSEPVIKLPFRIRPKTAPVGDDQQRQERQHILFRTHSSRGNTNLPGRTAPRLASPGSQLSGVLFGSEVIVDTDAGYDGCFAILLLMRCEKIPQLVTTVHGMAEAVSGAMNIKRLLTTIGFPEIPVVPSSSSTRIKSSLAPRVYVPSRPGTGAGNASRMGSPGIMSRPGSALLRPEGLARRIPSRFGPDYRRQLALLADHLYLAPFGIRNKKLLVSPGLIPRLAGLENDLRKLSMVAQVGTNDLEERLEDITERVLGLHPEVGEYYDTVARELHSQHSRRNTNQLVLAADVGERLNGDDVEAGTFHLSNEGSFSPSETRLQSPNILDKHEESGNGLNVFEGTTHDNSLNHHNKAVSSLLSQLSASMEPTSLLCLASLSNLALALEHNKELVLRQVKNVVVMGGAIRVSPTAWHDHAFYSEGGAEFNFYYDPAAARRVLYSGLDIVLVGLEVANAEAVSSENLEILAHGKGSSTYAWLLQQLLLMFDMAPSYAAVAAYFYICPEAFRTEHVWVNIDGHTGRMTETLPDSQGSIPVSLVTAMDHEQYFEFLNGLVND